MKSKRKIIIDPLVNIYYASFYIYGFIKLYGKCNVKFHSEPFKNISLTSRTKGVLIFVVVNGKEQRKYVINFDDSYKLDDELYDWCDVYGNVNTNYYLTPEKYHNKLISIAPSFGIKLWSLPKTVYYAFTNLLKSKRCARATLNTRNFLGKYKRMYKLRVPYSNYRSKIKQPEGHYVFHLSTLWYNDEWNKNDEGVNKTRANFIRACKQIQGLVFEGGMVSQGADRSSEKLFSDSIYASTVSMNTWMKKTKESAVVFNTPAFWNCHGWKLGEYLAMGKCIMSTELSNDLPVPLEHGKNIHIVENKQEAMKEAIAYILNHREYRLRLEQGAKSYWEQYGAPIAALNLLGIKNDS